MNITPTARIIVLPITTRGIGFIVRGLVCKLARLKIQQVGYHVLAGALYRVTLLAAEVKLTVAKQYTCGTSHGRGFQLSDIADDYMRCIGELGANFRPISEYIASVGRFTAFSAQYLPRHPESLFCDGRNTYNPCCLTFSNLRQYVVAMANQATPVTNRMYFQDHNPIPNAIWNAPQACPDAEGVQVRNPLIQNPDDIKPDNYDIQHLRADIDIMDAVEIVERKYPKYVCREKIDYTAKGSASQLTSCTIGSLRCSEITNSDGYAKANPVIGQLDHCWSPERLTADEMLVGARYLYGEVPSHCCTAFTPRHESIAKFSMDCGYLSLLPTMIG